MGKQQLTNQITNIMTHKCEEKTGMIVAYGIVGCNVLQKPFCECMDGLDPNGRVMRVFKEGYRTDRKLFLLVRAQVLNKCNMLANLVLEPYPSIDASMVLLLTGKYRDEFYCINPEEREGAEIAPEYPGVSEYIQDILKDYYVFREIRTIKIISGPPEPEETLRGRNSILNAIYGRA